CGTAVYMPQRFFRGLHIFREKESHTPLKGVFSCCTAEYSLSLSQPLLMRSWNSVCVEQLDLISGCIVETADKHSIIWHNDVMVLCKQLANSRIVDETCDQTSIGATITATTSPTVVCSREGVVYAGGTMAEDDDQWCKAFVNADIL